MPREAAVQGHLTHRPNCSAALCTPSRGWKDLPELSTRRAFTGAYPVASPSGGHPVCPPPACPVVFPPNRPSSLEPRAQHLVLGTAGGQGLLAQWPRLAWGNLCATLLCNITLHYAVFEFPVRVSSKPLRAEGSTCPEGLPG